MDNVVLAIVGTGTAVITALVGLGYKVGREIGKLSNDVAHLQAEVLRLRDKLGQ